MKKKALTKNIIISNKTADQVFKDFKLAARKVQKGTFRGKTEYEISFDNETDFNNFMNSIPEGSGTEIERYTTGCDFGKALGLTDREIDLIQENKKLKAEVTSLQRRLKGTNQFVSGEVEEYKIGDHSRLARFKRKK